MLFNSYSFLFIFLPVTFILFFILQTVFKGTYSILYLFIVSVVFYGYWNPVYLPLLLASIAFNYCISLLMNWNNRWFYCVGVTGNLALLTYFKYSSFLLSNISLLFNQPIELLDGDLPLGISFFTFTQIAYLTDCYRKEIPVPKIENYGLFVTFFPHLMAGPILHHKEIMPQFKQKNLLNWENIAVGLTLFSIGLFKKTMIADSLAPYANTLFDAASKGPVTCLEAWCGTLAYTFQLYFDFSGYSDMAIGLARVFGIMFPLNFNSPYKAANISEFWRRWHMTLSRFLRDYIYIPLGGNRKGSIKRYTNLLITMIIGGIWHGAAWTFIIWGMLHGMFLMINHLWLSVKKSVSGSFLTHNLLISKLLARTLTFLAVTFAWIFFRAESFTTSHHILKAMMSLHFSLASTLYNASTLHHLIILLGTTGFIVFFAPNSQQLLYQYKPALETYPGEIEPYRFKPVQWKPNAFTAALCALMTVLSLLAFGHISEFLYYKF
ncbi:MBOAT family O-acyltransferase [Legionella worsleiensis]|uniref:Probable alginate O-acetylase n=1 Tax=Legionella worsleiensis TaxID=45076 RepID=A0A0W1A3I0_9GAMM|nr:MBOAT family O-acyltransferase [Legionella worsleiensis]KTD75866.1 alginate O-acetyltransferase AlgI [Legionella worsleiensis]STY32879.1 alginate O-acetyltransferase AlgI [Legionella worsleiensis]